MKKRAHIPHNYEMSYEIRQEGILCWRWWCVVPLAKQIHMSQKTVQPVEKLQAASSVYVCTTISEHK